MAFALNHVHLKTPDPEGTAAYYVANFGATIKARPPGRGVLLDLHGLQLSVSNIAADQNHEQHYGIEHIAVSTDDYVGTMAALRQNGVTILEEVEVPGFKVAWVQAPDGAQVEILHQI